jgi:hypothetical protein
MRMEQRSDSSRRRAHPSAPAQTSQTERAGHASKPLRIAGYGPSSRPRPQQNAPKGADTRSTRTSPKCRWGTDATEAEPSPGSSIHVAGLGIEADGVVLTNVRVLLTRTLRGNSVTRRRASVPECRTHGSNLCAVILAEADVRVVMSVVCRSCACSLMGSAWPRAVSLNVPWACHPLWRISRTLPR